MQHYSLAAKLRYMGYFAILLNPQEENICYYFHLGTCIGALKTHVLLIYWLSYIVHKVVFVFCCLFAQPDGVELFVTMIHVFTWSMKLEV